MAVLLHSRFNPHRWSIVGPVLLLGLVSVLINDASAARRYNSYNRRYNENDGNSEWTRQKSYIVGFSLLLFTLLVLIAVSLYFCCRLCCCPDKFKEVRITENPVGQVEYPDPPPAYSNPV